MRRRFFVEQFQNDRAVIEGEAAHHLGRVLRAEVGQVYELSDGKRACLARIENVARKRIEFSLLEELPSHVPKLETTLLLSVVKFDAFEWAIEKATELGVARIVPLAAARSEKALLRAAPHRAPRWEKILLEASQQSRRLRVPTLAPLAKPEDALAARSDSLRVFLSERLEVPSLRDILKGPAESKATLAIGPEGGWTDDEHKVAGKAQYREASLGRLILRTETAAVAALASLNYALGAD